MEHDQRERSADLEHLEELGSEQLSALHRRWREMGVTCTDAASRMLGHIRAAPSTPLARAVAEMAAAADGSGIGNAYHNPSHSREVALDWLCLALRSNLACEEVWLLMGLCAAFAHDLDHDGGTGSRDPIPFRLERRSAAHAEAILAQAGVGPAQRAAIRCAILCTEPKHGYDELQRALSDDTEFGSEEPSFTQLVDPEVLKLCTMLRDADLLPSVGLTLEDYRARTAEMEVELSLVPGGLGGAAARGFFHGVVRRGFFSPEAQAFETVLDKIRAQALAES